ncbi:MAG TPA: PQQ-binding-like beta-propeller repeat protein [Streptosporangiaceae bacterium]|nr:PQQ-binding-like beta-propeller repeat protein [Streptosporangiaceae bacterium]
MIWSKPALVTAAVAACLGGMLAVAGTAGALPLLGTGHGHAPARVGTFADWPMFRGDPLHSGVSADTTIGSANVHTLTAGWTATLGTSSFTSPAVATSASLGKALVYAGANGSFDAYPATGGTPVWTFKTGKGGGAIETSPDVFQGVVYIASTAGTIYALNASTGALLCSYKTGQLIQASPVVVDAPDGSGPVVYEGTDPGAPGQELAVYGPGNTHGSCALDWQFTAFQVSPGGSWSSPAYGTDAHGTPLLVFGSVDTDDSVYALNATTGALAWRYNTSSTALFDVGSAPTISAPGVNGFADGVVYAVAKDHSVYAIDLTTGSLVWSRALVVGSNGDVSGTALAGDTLFTGSDTGMYSLNATTGAILWHVQPTHTFYASPVVTGPAGKQVVVVGNNEGRLYAFNPATGAIRWTQRPTTKGFWASPAVSQGTIYDIGLDGVLRSYAPAALLPGR